MKRIMFNDWQEMALKKDIELIIRKIDSQESVFYSICWETVIAIGTILLDHLFEFDKNDMTIWIIVAVAAIIPPICIIGHKGIRFVKKVNRAHKGNLTVKEFVDLFDNQICYWVMMSNAYSHLLSELKSADREEAIFLYQEGCYYNNKAQDGLYRIKPVVDKVFVSSDDISQNNGAASLQRLLNMRALIAHNQAKLNEGIKIHNTAPAVLEQKRINEDATKKLSEFMEDVKKCFPGV